MGAERSGAPPELVGVGTPVGGAYLLDRWLIFLMRSPRQRKIICPGKRSGAHLERIRAGSYR